MAADSLVARHRAMPDGGWAWRSSIQAPHYQTDRDVGAASVGEGLLAAYAVTHDPRYGAPPWRRATSCSAWRSRRPAACAGPTGRIRTAAGRTTHYTSFDDGAAGISDYLWTLYEVTREPRFRGGALARHALAGRAGRRAVLPGDRLLVEMDGRSVLARRVLRRRHGPGGHRPRARRVRRPHRRLDLPRLRTRRRRSAAGADGGRHPPAAARLGGAATLETGFLSGSAGAAYMFLERYRRDRDPADLAAARRLLAWVERPGRGGLSGGRSAGRSPTTREPGRASGFELGVAGIAWVNLQAARATGDADVPRRRAPGGRVAQTRRDRRRRLGRAARRCRPPRARRARQRRGRDRLGARGPRPRGHRHGRRTGRPRARRSPGSAPRRAAIDSGRSGTRTGRAPADGCAPSPRGTGAPPGSPPSRPGSPAGPAGLPAGSPEPDRRQT